VFLLKGTQADIIRGLSMIVVLPICTISPFSKGAKAHFDDAIIVIATAYKCDNLRIVLILFLSKLKLCNNLKKILQ